MTNKSEVKLTFKEWFLLQHGPRPSTENLYELADQAKSAEYLAAQARDLYNRTKEWDARHTSALYAYNGYAPKARKKK